ncbi:hypothetical protein [Terracidiphilus gabretensis]|jgi:hypothetical protein|uniref:hypothetical protein n=1 Tax=Terracidiphilus gabretensis TaxID=1577687 RepID=UPI00071B3F0F|nr:hypothetical protein [Terracidiphilus gabretensis]
MSGFFKKQVLLGALICLSCALHAQDSAAALLHSAASCLATKGFLRSTKTSSMVFGYFLDEKSYPRARVLYVVNYRSPSRSDGFVFTIFLTEHDDRQDFNVQNNARFVLSKDGDKGVSFVDPPLGGTWTQEHLVSAIRHIEKQSKFTISIENPAKVDSSISCEAYTDPQPKPTAK